MARKKRNKKLKTRAEIAAEAASKQLQSKRFHEKVKESGKHYKRQGEKKESENQIADVNRSKT